MTVNMAMVVAASRAAGLSISHTNISRVYREYHRAQITSALVWRKGPCLCQGSEVNMGILLEPIKHKVALLVTLC